MLPPETLPPGDPSGRVVYLRNEILSLQKALCLFLNMDVLEGGVVSTSPNPLSWRTAIPLYTDINSFCTISGYSLQFCLL